MGGGGRRGGVCVCVCCALHIVYSHMTEMYGWCVCTCVCVCVGKDVSEVIFFFVGGGGVHTQTSDINAHATLK